MSNLDLNIQTCESLTKTVMSFWSSKMRIIIPLICLCLVVSSCKILDNTDDQPVLAGKVERKLTVTTGREYGTGFGEDYGEGGLYIQKTNSYLTLSMTDFSSSINTPRTMRTILDSFEGNLFQGEIIIGDTWEQRGHRGGTEQVSLQGYEDVEVSNQVYPKCLKHKTVIKDAKWESRSELGNALVNGTRYLWFSPGIGVVKLRYEHSNGVITEGELVESEIPSDNVDLFPIEVGNSWQYKWKNNFENLEIIEDLKIFTNKKSKDGLGFNSYASIDGRKKKLDGNFYFYPKEHAPLKISGAGYSHTGREIPEGPRSIFIELIENYYQELLRYPIRVGMSWSKEGYSNVKVTTFIEEFETIETSLGTFKDCLKHKTVFKGATVSPNLSPEDSLEVSLTHGTRYLWFVKGIGIVKIRFEHANGITTEAELIDYNVPNGSKAYFPLNTATAWTYKWHNKYQPSPMIEKIAILDIHDTPEISIIESKYTITIPDETEPGEMVVDFELLPVGSNFEEMKLRLKGDSDYIPKHSQFVPDHDEYKSQNHPLMRGITVKPDPIGRPHYNEYPYPAWTIKFFKHRTGGIMNLKYEISTEYAKHYKAFMSERYGTQFLSKTRPIFRDNSMLWFGGDLFIIGKKTDNIEVEFILPDGWDVLTPWNRIGNSGYRFTVDNQKDLTENFILIGEFDEVVAESGKTKVVIGLDSKFKSSKDEIQLTVEEYLNAYLEIFKGGPDYPVTLLINHYEEDTQERMEGYGRRHSVSILMGEIVNPDTKYRYGPFLGHEVFHIWNGLTSLSRFSSKEKWFSEGVTYYYSYIISRQLGYLSESEYLRKLERACEMYLSVSHEYAIGDNYRDSRLAYEGGSLIAAVLDFQIRHHTQNRKNLNHVIQDLYRKFPDNTLELTNEDIIRSVIKVYSKDMRLFFDKYVLGKERLPLKEYLAYGGLDFEITSYEKIPTYVYVVGVIKKSLERDNMVDISSVDGKQVMSTLDLCKLAADWKSGDVIEFSYKEIDDEGEFQTEKVTLKGISDNPPSFQEVSVRITKQEKMNRLQRRIYSDLFEKE